MVGRISLVACCAALASCGSSNATHAASTQEDSRVDSAAGVFAGAKAYAGHDRAGIPNYTRRVFTLEERALLRDAYGIEDPSRLYVSDSTPAGWLKYDTAPKRCSTCYVNSYGVGLASIRRRGESWQQLERRVATMPLRAFPQSARHASASLNDLDPSIRDDVVRMLAAAKSAGFEPRVVTTYRSPLAEAFLMRTHRGTHTLTSMHSYGRAVDVAIGDGNARHSETRRRWIAFRRWVVAYGNGEFRILGAPDSTWDWPHVEIPSPDIGFHDIDAAIARARACTVPDAKLPCDFPTPMLDIPGHSRR